MAGPVTHTLINTVAAPVERVFDTLTDPARMVDWLPACAGVEAKLPVRKGSRYTRWRTAGAHASGAPQSTGL